MSDSEAVSSKVHNFDHDFHCQEPQKLMKKLDLMHFSVKLFISISYDYHENLTWKT